MEHQQAIRFAKQEHDESVNQLGERGVNLKHMHGKQVSMESDMETFASDVLAGFNRTEETSRSQKNHCSTSGVGHPEFVNIDSRLLEDVPLGKMTVD